MGGKEKFEAATGKELYAAHNNWILGKERKIQRQKYRGWWFLRQEMSRAATFGRRLPHSSRHHQHRCRRSCPSCRPCTSTLPPHPYLPTPHPVRPGDYVDPLADRPPPMPSLSNQPVSNL